MEMHSTSIAGGTLETPPRLNVFHSWQQVQTIGPECGVSAIQIEKSGGAQIAAVALRKLEPQMLQTRIAFRTPALDNSPGTFPLLTHSPIGA
jgi:hypothetical protein